MTTRSQRTTTAALLALLAALPPLARARAEAGTVLENVELATLAGGKAPLLSAAARANVVVFFRPGQDRSVDALAQMAACERELAGKPVHWAAVVSGSEPRAQVQAAVQQAGLRMPVLIDEGDRLYDRLGIRLHPVVGIADGKFVLAALEPYRQLEYCDVIRIRIRMLLGEATQADLDEVLNPKRGALPGEDPVMKAHRDVNMARRLVEIGQYRQALEYAGRALQVAPVARAHTVMGQAYAKLGRCAEARRSFAQAVKLDAGEQAAVEAARGSCR